MHVTPEGLALIRRFEGLRTVAYKCPAGVWTIGYGHTAAAGPPAVAGGMTVTVAEAEVILARDVEQFAQGVAQCLRQPLTDAQFSALVSFAYNVGIGNFRASSVLAAVNAGDLAAVPRRLALWVKAGGAVLPGLVTRRAAEAALFLSDAAALATTLTPEPVTPDRGTPPIRSTTIWAAIIAALSAVTGAVSTGAVAAACAGIAVVAAAWVIGERLRHAHHDGL